MSTGQSMAELGLKTGSNYSCSFIHSNQAINYPFIDFFFRGWGYRKEGETFPSTLYPHPNPSLKVLTFQYWGRQIINNISK